MLGSRLGDYRILDTLGVGGMGTVYRARVERDAHGLARGLEVALKVLHGQLLEQPGSFQRFLREAEVGRQVRHRNVVRSYDCDAVTVEDRSVHYLVMELVEGQTLRGLLEELSIVPEELCLHIAKEVAQALEAIHGANAVHRDLKPENVMITRAHEVKVMDLGVAHLQDEVIRLSRTGAFVGSIEYAAPEQFTQRFGPVDGRADLHALGVMLYELGTGRHPFRQGSMPETLRSVLDGDMRPAGEVNPQLSAFFEEVIHTLVARDPAERFTTSRHLQEVLREGVDSPWWEQRAAALREKQRRPLRRPRLPRETALHGREAELDRLRDTFRKAASGDGQVVLLEGEAGIGKTRLVDELVYRLRNAGEDLTFLFGSYPPGGAATAAGAFSTAYREHFGVEALEAELESHLRVTPVLVPAFAALLRGDAPPDGAVALTKDSLQTVFVHVTRSLAQTRPTVVLIDDLHFAPEEGRALFSALAAAVADSPILLIGAMRQGLDATWISSLTRLDHASQIVLSRLGPKDLAEMLEDAFQSKHLAKELSHLVSLKSDGNPFFAFEILRGLREQDLIKKSPDGDWVSTGRITDVQVPSSVLDLVEARMSSLTEEERDLLDVSACCGFEFDPCLVAEAVGMSRIPALKCFARIERRQRLVRSAGHKYAFDHHQVLEALLAHLMPQLRREYHAALGDTLAKRDAHGEPEGTSLDGASCVAICEQHLRGSRAASALRYLRSALDHLEGGYLNDQAIRLADQALEAEGLLEGTSRARILIRKAGRLELVGRREEQALALREARVLAEESGEPTLLARALIQLGGHQRLMGRVEDAEQDLERARSLARDAGDAGLEADASTALGNNCAAQGRYEEARRHLEAGLELMEATTSPADARRKLGGLAATLHSLGEVEEAIHLFEEHLQLSIEAGDRQGEELARGNLGLVLIGQGQLARAREHYVRGLTLAREIGDREGEAYLHGSLANVDLAEGKLERAQRGHERALALHRELGHVVGQAMATGNLGNVCHALGHLDEAQRYYVRCLELCRTCSDRYLEVLCLNAQGQTTAMLGAFADAQAILEGALALTVEMNAPGPQAEILTSQAGLAADRGDATEALALADEALAILEPMGNTETACYAYLTRARLREAAGDEAGARADCRLARDMADAMENADNQLRSRALLLRLGEGEAQDVEAQVDALGPRAAVLSRLEVCWLLGEVTGKRAHLEEAQRLLTHLRAHAPEASRVAMIERVPMLRAIHEATG